MQLCSAVLHRQSQNESTVSRSCKMNLHISLETLELCLNVPMGSRALELPNRSREGWICTIPKKTSGDDLNKFLIECVRARDRWCLPTTYICMVVGHRWPRHGSDFSGSTLGTVICRCDALHVSSTGIWCVTIVDVYPNNSITVAAVSNITSCVLLAVVVTILHLMVDTTGLKELFQSLVDLNGGRRDGSDRDNMAL